MARYISLYSGSSGNCSVVEENGKFILIDMGKSARLTNKALTELGLDIKNLQGILVSHEHTDHTAGLKVFLKNLRVPVYTGWATADYLTARDMIPAHIEVNDIDFSGFNIGDFYVKGFETPHDSVGCMGFRIATEKGRKMSIATDLGFVTEDIFNSLRNVDLAVVESNYDVQMLKEGPYPYYPKYEKPLRHRFANGQHGLQGCRCRAESPQCEQARRCARHSRAWRESRRRSLPRV